MTTPTNSIKFLSWGERRQLLTQCDAAKAKVESHMALVTSQLSSLREGYKNAAANDARNQVYLNMTMDHSQVLAAYRSKGQQLTNELAGCKEKLTQIKATRNQITGWFLWMPRLSTIAKGVFTLLAGLGLGAGTSIALNNAVMHASTMA